MDNSFGLERLEQRRMLASVTVAPLPAGHSVEQTAVVGDVLYYGVLDNSDRENVTSVLWRTDGTAAGTRPVRDDSTGDNVGIDLGGRLIPLGEKLLVLDNLNTKLWVVDYRSGLATHLISFINPVSDAPSSTVLNGVLYFNADNGQFDQSLWRTDGTVSGTNIVTDLGTTATTFPDCRPRDITAVGSRLFFTAEVGTSGRELYVSDGTWRGTRRVMNLIPDTYNGKFPEVSPQGLAAAANGRVVFTTPGYKSGGVWSSDGTPEGTILLARGGGHGFISTGGGRVVYKGEGAGGVFDYALWGTDGTPAGTAQLYDPPTEISSMPLTVWNAKAYLPLQGSGGPQYIGTDGTVAGTVQGALPFTSGLRSFDSWPERFGARMVFIGAPAPEGLRGLYATGADAVGNQLLVPAVEKARAAYSRVYYFTKGADDAWMLNAYAPNAGTLAGKVFDDANANGVRDAGERPLVGHKVFIDRNGDGVCNKTESWTRTSSSGAYRFDLLPAGTYRVRIVGIGGQRGTTPDSFRVRVPAEGRVTRYFGRTAKGGVTGTVYEDANRNGTQDSNEAGLSGFTIYADRDGDDVFDLGEASAATNAQGLFELVTLDAGNQTVRVAGDDLDSYEFVKPATGEWSFVQAAGEINVNFHFGLVQIA